MTARKNNTGNNSWVFGQLAHCHDCGKRWENHYKNRARLAAYTHARKFGHVVDVETVTIIRYHYK
jgi:hypothetical protein